jgi:hypothetical protein
MVQGVDKVPSFFSQAKREGLSDEEAGVHDEHNGFKKTQCISFRKQKKPRN